MITSRKPLKELAESKWNSLCSTWLGKSYDNILADFDPACFLPNWPDCGSIAGSGSTLPYNPIGSTGSIGGTGNDEFPVPGTVL